MDPSIGHGSAALTMAPTLRKRPSVGAPATPTDGKRPRNASESDRIEQDAAVEERPPVCSQVQLAFDAAGGGDDQESDDDECGEPGWVPAPPWRSLNVPPSELRLAVTLMSGQSFRWERRLVSHAADADENQSWRAQYPSDMESIGARVQLDHRSQHIEYAGPINCHLFVLRETPTNVFFRVLSKDSAPDAARDCLRRYLRLPPAANAPPDQKALWRGDLDIQTSSVDPGLAQRLERFPGVRLLALPLLESVICFMGSANNNIKRNSQMIAAVCSHFQENYLGSVGGTDFYAFPSLEQMSTLDEATLFELGWGYRAPRFVKLCPELVALGGEQWLETLMGGGRDLAREKLCQLTGVGRKVADCITLFSLCCDDCIPVRFAPTIKSVASQSPLACMVALLTTPTVECVSQIMAGQVDTHAWQFMQRAGYLPQLKKASGLTDANYALIGETLRKRYGDRAGWAFIVLFVAEVRQFRCSSDRALPWPPYATAPLAVLR
jgi:N-glycosylase/DNA lyase